MRIFNRRIVPVIVTLNFILSCMIIFQLAGLYIWNRFEYNDSLLLIIRLLLISMINLIVIAVTRKKCGNEFSVSGYILFVITIPCISPVMMYYIVRLISEILYRSGVGFSMV